jgi:hypothetical protein
MFYVMLLLLIYLPFVGAASSSSPSSNTHNTSKIVAAATTVTVATEITSKQDIVGQDIDMEEGGARASIQSKKRGRTNKEDVDEDKKRKKKVAMYLRTTSIDVGDEPSSLVPAPIGPFPSPLKRDNEEVLYTEDDDEVEVTTRGRKRTSLERDEEDIDIVDSKVETDENAQVEDKATKKRDRRLAQRRELYAKNKKKVRYEYVKKKEKPWNEEEEKLFEDVVKTFSGWGDWASVARNIPNRTKSKRK